jgi:DNA-binding transcriptional regulator/RsmH inhibitor MraZ
MTLDDKLRFTVPAQWRINVAEPDGQRGGFFLLPNEAAEMRLVAYPREEMDFWAQRLMGLPHGHPDWEQIARWSTAAEYCPIDRNGRLTMPRRLTDHIAVFPRETIVLFGVIRRFEICSLAMAPKEWDLDANDDD